jgi:hypothetical protein
LTSFSKLGSQTYPHQFQIRIALWLWWLNCNLYERFPRFDEHHLFTLRREKRERERNFRADATSSTTIVVDGLTNKTLSLPFTNFSPCSPIV